ncbi:hypothetical protein HKX48_006533 [Thoreauomyces humboldtii]|nr:hypothetical protein HKX48_006533 [Thoreauomyces humboldtii]
MSLCKDPVVHQSIYLEFEIKVKLELWAELEAIIEYAESTTIQAPIVIFERMADIVTRNNCPSEVVFLTIRSALNTILKRVPDFDMRRFSQWFRILIRTSMVTSSVTTRTTDDETRSLGLYRQVLSILDAPTANADGATQGSAAGSYPKSEIEWLCVTAWNRGCEWWGAGRTDRAREWCEMAVSVGHHADPSDLVKQMRESYSDMLAGDEMKVQ